MDASSKYLEGEIEKSEKYGENIFKNEEKHGRFVDVYMDNPHPKQTIFIV